MRFDHSVPTRVVFGRGRLDELGTHVGGYGSAALVVCGRAAMRRHGVLERITTHLTAAGVHAVVFDGVSPDPRADEVDAAVALAAANRCDVVVGVGGGSALDAAKAAAVGLRHGPVGPLVGETVPGSPDAVPVVAVPTTAGSGSEVTRGAIITDPARRLKAGIRGADLFPRLALIDPALAATVPPAVAAETAFDALAHAVEGYVARSANPVSRAQAAQALELLARRLPQLARGTLDDDARDDLALAALLGGFNVANASTCLPHRLQQAMGVLDARISHGRGLACVYPAWLRTAGPAAPDAFATVAAHLGGTDVHEALCTFRTQLGLTARLTDHGVGPGDIPLLVSKVTGNTANDPLPEVTAELIAELYAAS